MPTNHDSPASNTAAAFVTLIRALAVRSMRALYRSQPTDAQRAGAADSPVPQHSAAEPRAVVRPADLAIRNTLIAALERQPTWRADVSNVFVIDGVVVYQGLCERRKDRQATRIARMIAGVREVRDTRVRMREWQAMA